MAVSNRSVQRYCCSPSPGGGATAARLVARVAVLCPAAAMGECAAGIQRAERVAPWYVLLRRAASGGWNFPGGGFDLSDESPEVAAERELFEEIGLCREAASAPLVPIGSTGCGHADKRLASVPDRVRHRCDEIAPGGRIEATTQCVVFALVVSSPAHFRLLAEYPESHVTRCWGALDPCDGSARHALVGIDGEGYKGATAAELACVAAYASMLGGNVPRRWVPTPGATLPVSHPLPVDGCKAVCWGTPHLLWCDDLCDAVDGVWSDRCAAQPSLFNGSKFCLTQVDVTDESVLVWLGVTDYRSSVAGSNVAGISALALGVEALVVTADGKAVLFRRGPQVAFPGQLCCPGGHAEPSTAAGPATATKITGSAANGVAQLRQLATAVQAAGPAPTTGELFDSPIDEVAAELGVPRAALTNLGVCGFACDSDGKPDAMFLVRCEYSGDEISTIFAERKMPEAYESDASSPLTVVSLEKLKKEGTSELPLTEASRACISLCLPHAFP